MILSDLKTNMAETNDFLHARPPEGGKSVDLRVNPVSSLIKV